MRERRLKIVELWKLLEILKAEKSNGKKVVFTNGCFDILHAGHVASLEFARSYGDILVVGLNSDKSVRSIKGDSRPIIGEADRAHMLAALETIDYITLFNEDTPALLIHALQPDFLVKGADWAGKRVAGSEDAGQVIFAPITPGLSTSEIIRRCREGGNF